MGDVEAWFADSPLGLEIHRRVLALLAPLGTPGIRVTKTQVAFRGRRAFAWIWLPGTWLRRPQAEVVLSVALPRRDASPRWKEVVRPSPRAWMHHLEIRDVADLDDEVAAWLKEAWEAAGGPAA